MLPTTLLAQSILIRVVQHHSSAKSTSNSDQVNERTTGTAAQHGPNRTSFLGQTLSQDLSQDALAAAAGAGIVPPSSARHCCCSVEFCAIRYDTTKQSRTTISRVRVVSTKMMPEMLNVCARIGIFFVGIFFCWPVRVYTRYLSSYRILIRDTYTRCEVVAMTYHMQTAESNLTQKRMLARPYHGPLLTVCASQLLRSTSI